MDDEIEIRVVGLVYNHTIAGTYALVMGEAVGSRRFSIMIGEPEAQSIALKLNNKVSVRSLTHDLIKNLLITFGATFEKAVIYDMVNDVFYSELHIQHGDELIVIDARTSDAVALAVRCDAPIFIRREILNIVGITVDNELQVPKHRPLPDDLNEINASDLQYLANDELQKLLNRALDVEKYELAAMIRNETNRR
ncbi:MAG: bifunctional nuclease family protein [Prevotellaceae bacterium]|jgi:bifunctional DNase/RNase|nr:bifunctional nuclease family protein [Prevotellaceae bacterium]